MQIVLFHPNSQTWKVKRVIAVGRYDYQKGFDELINIWKEVYAKHPDWSLDIFGHGPLKDELQSLIDQLGLTKRFIYVLLLKI